MSQTAIAPVPQIPVVSQNAAAGSAPAESGNQAQGAQEGSDFAALLEKQITGNDATTAAPAAAAVVGASQESGERGAAAADAQAAASAEASLAALLPDLMALPAAPPAAAAAPNTSANAAATGIGQNVGAVGTGTSATVLATLADRNADRSTRAAPPETPAVIAAAVPSTAESAELPAFEPPTATTAPTGDHAGVGFGVHSAPVAQQPAVARIDTPLGTAQWNEDFSQKLSLLVGRDISRAEIILNPPHLGRVEVSLTVSADSTTAQFVAANPVAREAIEQALPRLREVLAQAGVNLGQTSVSAESTPRDPGQSEQGRDGRGIPDRSPRLPAAVAQRFVARGLVDTFA